MAALEAAVRKLSDQHAAATAMHSAALACTEERCVPPPVPVLRTLHSNSTRTAAATHTHTRSLYLSISLSLYLTRCLLLLLLLLAYAVVLRRLLRHLEQERLLVQKLLAGSTSNGVDAMMTRVMPFYLASSSASHGGRASN